MLTRGSRIVSRAAEKAATHWGFGKKPETFPSLSQATLGERYIGLHPAWASLTLNVLPVCWTVNVAADCATVLFFDVSFYCKA